MAGGSDEVETGRNYLMNWVTLDLTFNARTSLSNVIMELRKCCNHPYLFDGAEPEFDGQFVLGIPQLLDANS